MASVMQHRSFDSPPKLRPFVILRASMDSPEIRDDGVTIARATYHRAWIHDWPGSYLAIDAVAQEIRGVVETAVSSGQLVRAEWMEDSEDHEDPDLGTILRWCRIRIVHRT